MRATRFSIAVVSTLALAVGCTVAVLSLADGLWFRHGDQPELENVVVVLGNTMVGGSGDASFFTRAGLASAAWHSGSFAMVAGEVQTSGNHRSNRIVLTRSVGSVPLEVAAVTPEYFQVVHAPILGRGFSETDNRPGAEAVAIISRQFWKAAFGSRSEVVGQILTSSPAAVRIVGVVTDDFRGAFLGERVDAWVPAGDVAALTAGGSSAAPDALPLTVIARLAPGVTAAVAERRLVTDLQRRRSSAASHLGVISASRVFGAVDHKTMVISESTVATLVAVAAALILLAGTATVTALVALESDRRRTEIAIRRSLGASDRDLLVPMSAELLSLGALGALLALTLGELICRVIPTFNLPGGVDTGRLDFGLDWRIVIGAVVAAIGVTACAAVIPVSRVIRERGERFVLDSRRGRSADDRYRRFVLGVHVATTALLLGVSAILVRCVWIGAHRGAGFDADRVLFVSAQPIVRGGVSGSTDASAGRALSIGRDVGRALEQVSSIEVVARGASPIGTDQLREMLTSRTVQTENGEVPLHVGWAEVGANYFQALGVPLVAGRTFSSSDLAIQSPIAAIVTVSLADRLWPRHSAIGHIFECLSRHFIVVGAIPDVAYGSQDISARFVWFSPMDDSSPLLMWVGRSSSPAAAKILLDAAVRFMPIEATVEVATGHDVVTADLARQELGSWFFGLFGVVSLVLAIWGIVSLTATFIYAQAKVIAIRLALGRQTLLEALATVARSVTPAVFGVCVGLIGALFVAKRMCGVLPSLDPDDPWAYGLVAGAVVLAALGAASCSVRRLWTLNLAGHLRSSD